MGVRQRWLLGPLRDVAFIVPSCVTSIEMATKCGGTTTRDRTEHRVLLRAQPRVLLEEGATLRVQDIGAAMIVGPILSALHLATVTWRFDSS
jgi:hypothetical protein